MTVEILRLSGLSAQEAERAAAEFMVTGPGDLSLLLVLDDAAMLAEHASAYESIDLANRVELLLCVAVGPRDRDGRLWLPWSLGGTQEHGVLWVGDRRGIDWRASAAANVKRHSPDTADGVDQLVELLQVEGIFKRVHGVMGIVPDRVASPGLRLATRADDEAATFRAALALAIDRITDPRSQPPGPFPALVPAAAGGTTLTEGGPLERSRREVFESAGAAVDALSRRGGLFGIRGHADSRLQEHVKEAGESLSYLRDLVARLLQDANSVGELTENQRQLLDAAGLRFPATKTGPGAAEQSLVFTTIAQAIRGGETLPYIMAALTLTEPAVKRQGSAAYLPTIDRLCPRSLTDRLSAPPGQPPRRWDAATARHELGLDDAQRAAAELARLISTVGNQEWSPATPTSGELGRARIALDGVRLALHAYVEEADDDGDATRGSRVARLSDSLHAALRDLVLLAVEDESAAPSKTGQEAFEEAQKRAGDLLIRWRDHVVANSIQASPPFPTASPYDVNTALQDDPADIKEALLYPHEQAMWQLCESRDTAALNVAVEFPAIRFASRLYERPLATALSSREVEWTPRGSFAGLMRLVPLRSGLVRKHRQMGGAGTSAEPGPPDPAE